MTDPQTETPTLSAAALTLARAIRRELRSWDVDSSAQVDYTLPAGRSWLIVHLLGAYDAQAAEIATLRETVANVGDAIAEYCVLHGDEGVPRDLAEAVRFIGRAGLTPPPSAGETK